MSHFSRTQWTLSIVGMLAAGALWCAADWWVALPADARPRYVGRESCAACHQTQLDHWTGSHHDRAMELATADSVLGDFDNAEFTRLGVTTKFFRRDGKYFVNAEGPDGQLHDYEVKYTFGIDPMQQYMVEFPDGRVQVLRVSWDTRKKKWFEVTPSDVPDERLEPTDPLHWTGMAQNWNTMCADCHSTDVHKNFNLATNTYETTFSEIDVSCETCHGPASMHVELAQSHSLFWDRRHGYGLAKLKGATAAVQLETCAPCHSRRTALHADFHGGDHFLDFYDPSLLRAGLYFPDGQIQDEVYEYGSFIQSKMYAHNVRCTDCHEPHTLALKYEGNRLCAQCHQPGKYDTLAHHRHTDATATQCVTCHMPTRTYMVIDERRDHSLKVPRPDLSVLLGTPNACNNCHTAEGEDAAWAAQKIREWYGDTRPGEPPFGPALAFGQQAAPGGLELLAEVLRRKETPDIVRASAAALLSNYPGSESDALCGRLMDDPNPLVRAAAVGAVSSEALTRHMSEVTSRLHDPVRIVRFAAAQRLVNEAGRLAEQRFGAPLKAALAEYRAAQELALDRAAAHINLSMISQQLGDSAAARESLETALRLEPYLSGVREELARAIEQMDGDAAEVKRLREEEVELLERDAKLLPDSSQPHYRRGMLLYLLEQLDEARQAFESACEVEPLSFDNWLALALICESQQDWERALEGLAKMHEIRPGDPAIAGIVARIRAAGGLPSAETSDANAAPGN